MDRKMHLAVVMVCMLSLAIVGCGDDRPEGFPEIYSTTITITQDGDGLEGATVTLFPEDSSLSRWPVGGVTDGTGKVELVTYTKYEGAPAGKFKVMVTKIVTEGDPIPDHPGANASPEELAAYDRAMKTGSFEAYQVVAQEFRASSTTPLTVEVTSGGENEFTLDVGEAVREEDIQGGVAGGGGEYVPMGGGE